MRTTIGRFIMGVVLLITVAMPAATPVVAGFDPSKQGWNMTGASAEAVKFGISTKTPSEIFVFIINGALMIIGFLGVLAFIISGIMYLVAAGDEKKVVAAKANIVYAIIGISVALIGFVIMAAISTLVTGSGQYL